MGDIIVDNGDKKETAKSLTEEELTGALVRASRAARSTVCFVNGSGEHTLDGYRPRRLFHHQRRAREEQLQNPDHLADREAGGPEELHHRGGRRPEARLSAAGDRCSQHLRQGWRPRHLQFRLRCSTYPSREWATPRSSPRWFAEWGVTPNGDVILDLSSASRMFGQISPVVGSYEQHPIVRVMQDNAIGVPARPQPRSQSPRLRSFSPARPKAIR